MPQMNGQDFEDLLQGTAFLASGGGGSIQMGKEILSRIPEPVELIEIEQVQPDQWGVVPFAGGAPSQVPPSYRDTFSGKDKFLGQGFFSKRWTSDARSFTPSDLLGVILEPFDLLEKILDKQFSYVMPLEIGPANTLLCMYVAAYKNIPIVNCDGAGRSIPSLNMLSYGSPDVYVYPATMASIQSHPEQAIKVVIDADQSSKVSDKIVEIMQTTEFDSAGVMAAYAMDGKTLRGRRPVIANTIYEALIVGRILRQAQQSGQDPKDELLHFFNSGPNSPRACVLTVGTIVHIKHTNIGRLDRIDVVIKGDNGEICILALNENLIACRDPWPIEGLIKDPIAMGPDLICYVTPDGHPLTNEEIREGMPITVIGLKAPPQSSQDPSIVQSYLTGLGILGYGPYVPLQVN